MKKIILVFLLVCMGAINNGCSSKLDEDYVNGQVVKLDECFMEARDTVNFIYDYICGDDTDLIGQSNTLLELENKLKEIPMEDIEKFYKNEKNDEECNRIKLSYLWTKRRISCAKEILKMYDDDNKFSDEEFLRASDLCLAANMFEGMPSKIERTQKQVDEKYNLSTEEIYKLYEELYIWEE